MGQGPGDNGEETELVEYYVQYGHCDMRSMQRASAIHRHDDAQEDGATSDRTGPVRHSNSHSYSHSVLQSQSQSQSPSFHALFSQGNDPNLYIYVYRGNGTEKVL